MNSVNWSLRNVAAIATAAVVIAAVAIFGSGLLAQPASAQQGLIIPDTGGHEQIDQGNGAQLDIAGVGVMGDMIEFAWDEPLLSGNNSSDACSYWQEPDGTVTALCYSVTFIDPAIPTYDTMWTVYDCGTSYGNGKCTGNNPTSSDYTAACIDPILVAPYFAADDPDDDLQAKCTLTGLNGNDPTIDLQYINTCTKPSASPSSLSNDCIFDPDSDPAFLSLDKIVVDGSAVPGDFTLTATNSGNAAESIGGPGGVTTTPVNAGTYDLTETGPATYGLDSIVCTDAQGNNIPVSGGQVTLPELTTVNCVYTNSVSLEAPAIGLSKTADPVNIAEPGGTVTFTIEIKNTGGDGTIDSLVDDIHGDLATSCVDTNGVPAVGQTLASGTVITCTFQVQVTGNANFTETDTVTTEVTNAAGSDTASDTATVTITDVSSSIDVTKTANPASVPEPGGDVTYTFVVDNTSAVDSVDITMLDDSIYGDLNGQGTCATPQTLAAGTSYTCSITETVSGNAGDVINNILKVTGTDDDGNPVGDTDDADVTISDVASSIEVTKTADPTQLTEPGGDVTYTFVVNNTSAVDSVDITLLDDSIYGDLNGQGTCATPQTLAAGASYTCSITETVSGAPGAVINNILKVTGTDDDGNTLGESDDADVTITDSPSGIAVSKTASPESVPEPGGSVTYTFVVDNTSAVDSVTIDSLGDSIYGDLNGQGTCATPQTLAAGTSYTCSITEIVSGNAGDVINNVLKATGTDDDGNPVGETDDADVTITDTPSSIEVMKTANPTSVDEPGGNVTYTFVVDNTSAVDSVDITSLDDSIYGDLNGQGTCATPQTLAAGTSYTCSITEFVGGNAGDVINNVLTAGGTDDDGNTVGGEDDADVTIGDVAPNVELIKTASPSSVDEPGDDVTFTITINNLSNPDTVTISSLDDSVYGDLNGQGTCATPQTIVAGASYSCSFTEFVSGNAGDQHLNVATAGGTDDDGGPIGANDDATVDINDVPSSIAVSKTADPGSVPETGGDVTFTVMTKNTSAVDDVTITSVTDSVLGDISSGCTPALPVTLAPGETITCTATEFLSGQPGSPHTNVATVTGTDDDGNPVEGDDDEDVPFDDVIPSINIVKSASPTSVNEPGGNVTFTFTVTNDGGEDVTLDALVDSVYGDLNGEGTCATGGTIAAGASYSCSIEPFISGAGGTTHTNVAKAEASDDDGNTVGDEDDENVQINDLPPSLDVTKTVSSGIVRPGGGQVMFTIEATNTSVGADPITVTTISDAPYGDILDPANPNIVGTTCAATTIQVGATYTCEFTVDIPGGTVGDILTDVVTVGGTDDEGNPVDGSDDAQIEISEELGTGTPGYWKNNGLDSWFDENGTLLIGDLNGNGVCDNGEKCIELTNVQALFLLDSLNYNDGQDKRYTLARSLVAAWLNVTVNNNDYDCIDPELFDAIMALQGNLPDVPGNAPDEGGSAWSGSTWSQFEPLYQHLDEYNNTGLDCAPDRDDLDGNNPPPPPPPPPATFACASDAGTMTWTDVGSSVYWVYKSTDGGATFNWIGRWKNTDPAPNPQTFTDPNATFGDVYQVRTPGEPAATCSVTNEPPVGAAFACASDAGSLTWTDTGSSVYWVYKSTDGGATYNWIGRWKNTDPAPNPQTFTDPNATFGDLYQIRQPGIAATNCTTTSQPPAGPAWACTNTNGTMTWTDVGSSVYWVYKSTDGGATYFWIGRWKNTDPAPNPQTFTDPAPAAGDLYQMRTPGQPATNCV